MKQIDRKSFLVDLNKPRDMGVDVNLKTALHEGQVKVLKALFKDNMRIVLVKAARKFGKTQTAIYAAYRIAGTTNNAIIYIVGPEKDHMAKVYWDGGRLPRFLGDDTDKYVENTRYNEKSIEFCNGSRIQLVSSDNIAAANGLTPNFIVYDEFKDHNPRFHTDMAPNLTAKGAKLLIIGTLPTYVNRNEKEYEAMVSICEQEDDCSVFTFTTWDNPIMNQPLQKKAIASEIKKLELVGDLAAIEREYYSRRSKVSTRNIFPMFDTAVHVKPHEEIISKLKPDWNLLEKWSVLDPAAKSTFGGLYIMYHPMTKRIIVLDEIYEKNQMETVLSKLGQRIINTMRKLAPKADISHGWHKLMDNAAARERLELADRFPELSYGVTLKTIKAKQDGVDLIKDLLLNNIIYISDKCHHLIWEIQRYHLNDSGKLVKKDDHLIDCLRYFLVGAGYSPNVIMEAKKEYPEDWENLKVGYNIDKEEYMWDVEQKEDFEVDDDYGDFDLYEEY